MPKKTEPMTVGEQIREVRLAAKMTQEKLLAEINHRRGRGAATMKQGHLSALENDHHTPTLAMLQEIAAATGHRLQSKLFVK